MNQPRPHVPNPMHARKRARRLALQALYQWQLASQNLKDIDLQFREEQDMSQVDVAYFHELLHKIPANLDRIDQGFAALVDRSVNEIDPVERAILRIAVYELLFRLDIPYRVILNEAVALAKTFGASESHRFINGALDQAAKNLRAAEVKADRG